MPSRKIDGYLFQFFSSDVGEPPHVHVKRSGSVAKIWLQPINVQYNHGYNNPELNRILRITDEHLTELLEMWNEHFRRN